MAAWLAILNEQVAKFAVGKQGAGGGSLAILQTGWVALRRADVGGDAVQSVDDAGRVYAVLAQEQKEVAQAITVTHTLYWFPNENASADLGAGTAFDLEEVEQLSQQPDGTIVLATDSSWQLEVKPEARAAEWLSSLKGHCINAEGYEAPEVAKGGAALAARSGKAILSRRMRMIVPRTGHTTLQGGGVWQPFDVELSSTGTLSFAYKPAASASFAAASMAPGWAEGTVDVTRAIGVWLLGSDRAPTLDIILAGKKHTLACDDGETGAKITLGQWKKAIEGLMPHKPTQELHRGWLEKQGEVGTGWKMRFFVLLSTRKLLYFESDSSSKQRGQVDLQTATHVRPCGDEFYNYEDAIEIVTAKRRWIVCPESRKDKEEWIAALLPMIGGESATEASSLPEPAAAMASFAPSGAAKRVSRLSVAGGAHAGPLSLGVALRETRKGWLERQEEGGQWSRRFFVLETQRRGGACEASIEYYLDEALSNDEDSETIHLMPGTTTRQAASDGPREQVFEVDTAAGTRLVFAAATQADCVEWMAAIRSAVSEAPAGKPKPKLADIASLRVDSTRSEGSSFAGAGKIPDDALRVHAGWLTKKGEGMMAKSQQRWFVLYRNAEVHYFDSEVMTPKGHKGLINLADVRPQHIARSKPGSTDFSFSIATPKRKWQLKAASNADYEAWERALVSIVGAS